MGVSGGMEADDDKSKKLNDDVVVYLSKSEVPRYSAQLRAYVDLQRKRSRAAAARRRSDHGRLTKKKNEKNFENSGQNKEENIDKDGQQVNKRRGGDSDNKGFFDRFRSRNQSQEPSDKCRRRRKCCCRRRRRRRSRSRRRRRSRCGRRRRRSRCRRRRRRSCRRRRRSCRRRRRRCR